MNSETQDQPARLSLTVASLDFDPHNPRFPAEVAAGPVTDLIERFVRDERLLEVVNSIADQGYFAGEPLLVVWQKETDRYIVVEGNRRLAALKLLSGLVDVPPGRSSIEDACASAKHRPTEVPCLVFANEDLILRYLALDISPASRAGEVCRRRATSRSCATASMLIFLLPSSG